VEVEEAARLPTGGAEIDRVLGGGVVPGSLVLVGGEPGVGKSTLLLQVADGLARDGREALYVSGEESAAQVRLRAERLGIRNPGLHVLAETSLERTVEEVGRVSPAVVVVDSVQTAHTAAIPSAPGTVGQVREVATRLLLLAKERALPVFLAGHVTKEGAIAGPRTLEHIVDAVLYFEGEGRTAHRIVRTVKNRFGPAGELGIFEMRGDGLHEVERPSELFLRERPVRTPGSAVACCLEGSRPLLVEVQALLAPPASAQPRRTVQGLDATRVALILAVLDRHLGLSLGGRDLFVNVAGGVELTEPAADLAVAAALVSSQRKAPLDPHTACFGEIGLGGEIRGSHRPEARLREAVRCGFLRCLAPASSLHGAEVPQGLEVVPVRTVGEAVGPLLGTSPPVPRADSLVE
jgi:DNA repair protein RadA/Sms